jgi:hypothetical protein
MMKCREFITLLGRGGVGARGRAATNFLSNHTEDQIPTFILSLSDTLGSPRDDRGRNRRYQPLSQRACTRECTWLA